MMKITKRNVQFQIDGKEQHSCNWFARKYDAWEEGTFDVLDRLLREDGTFIDIGAWIGPTALYAAAKCGHVYCLEPDPVAYARLTRNMDQNPQYSNNMSAFKLGIAQSEGKMPFGGNGGLGNSESTLLVAEESFIRQGGEEEHWEGDSRDWRLGEVIDAEMTTLDRFIQNAKVDIESVCLIKIDIEGGEKYVIPAIVNTLREHPVNLYLSLHWVFLKEHDIRAILDILYPIYPCVRRTTFESISKEEALREHVSELVFSCQDA